MDWERVSQFLQERRKALAAFLLALAAAYWDARTAASDGGAAVTAYEWLDGLLGSALVAFGVWGIPNEFPLPRLMSGAHSATTVDRP